MLLAAYRLRSVCFIQHNRLAGRDVDATHVDRDIFDAACTHVVVSDVSEPEQPVVGHVRLLDRESALRSGGFRTQRYYGIDRLLAQPARLAEVGRVCTHPGYRQGRVMDALFAGIYTYLVLNQMEFLFGVTDLWMDDLSQVYAALESVVARHPAPPRLRFEAPLSALSGDAAAAAVAPILDLPPLLLAYLNMGAYVADAPVQDHELGGYAIGVLLDSGRLPERVRLRYGRALDEAHRSCLA